MACSAPWASIALTADASEVAFGVVVEQHVAGEWKSRFLAVAGQRAQTQYFSSGVADVSGCATFLIPD